MTKQPTDPRLLVQRAFSADTTLQEAEPALAKAAVDGGYLDPIRLAECLQEVDRLRKEGREIRLEQVLVQRGFLTAHQLAEILRVVGHSRTEPSLPAFANGKYRILRLIGRGGMGSVYEAEEPELRRLVALKILRGEDAETECVTRLHREAAVMAQLHHPNIVGVYEVGTTRDADGRTLHFISMEFVPGKTFAEVIGDGSIPRTEKLRMLETVARAIAHAHSKGIVHRDLKPGNVLVETGGRVVLTDFGLAKAQRFRTRLTRSHEVMGTPQYMAPEQIEGKTDRIDARTDVYALGVMFYEILTGHLPFEEQTAAKLYAQILNADPMKPTRRVRSIKADAEVVCLKALEKNPSHRYRAAKEFADDLSRFLAGEPIHARPVSTWRKIVGKFRRKKLVVGLAGALVGVVFLAGLVVWRSEERRRKREEGLKRLAGLWSAIVERKRELRQLRRSPETVRGELEALTGQVDEHVREWPDDPQGYYVRGSGRLYLGDLEGAERDARGSLAKRNDFAPGWALLGTIRMEYYEQRVATPFGDDYGQNRQRIKTSLFQETLEAFEQARKGGGREGWEQWGLSWAKENEVMERLAEALDLMCRKKDAEAKRLLEEAVKEYAAEEYALRLAMLADSPEEKMRWYDRAIEGARGYAFAYLYRGVEKVLVCRDPQGGLEDINQAIELGRRDAGAYVGRAYAKKDLEDFPGALADCQRALELDPHYLEAYNAQGAVLWKKGDLAGAIAEYSRAIKIDENGPYAYVNRGLVKEAKGDRAGALQDYDRAIELKDDLAEAYRARGHLKHENRDSGALEDLDRAIALRPKYAEAYVCRGSAKENQGDWDGAIADATLAIELQNDFPMAYTNRGVAKVKKGDWEGGLADYDRAISLQPSYAKAYLNRGNLRIERKEPDLARLDYNRVIELEPNSWEAYFNRAQVREDEEDWEGALSDYDRGLDLHRGSDWAYHARGNVKRHLGKHADAMADYDRAIELGRWKACIGRGTAKMALGDWDGAIVDFELALEKKVSPNVAYFQRGVARENKGQWAQALEDYRQAISLGLGGGEVYRQLAGIETKLGDAEGAAQDRERADVLLAKEASNALALAADRAEKGNWAGAIVAYDRALELNPRLANAYASRGFGKLKRSDSQGAIADLSRALELEGDRAIYWHGRGLAKEVAGDWEGAIQDHSRTLELQANYPNAHGSRARAKVGKKDYAGAIIDFDRAIELDPKFAEHYFLRGEAKRSLGDLTGAAVDYNTTLKQDAKHVRACLELAAIRVSQERFQEAIEDYEHLQKILPPDAPLRRQVQEQLDEIRKLLKGS